MAHLTGPDRDSDRGQLLLVAVLVLAASFIVLALVINSAIFTENLATREDVAGSEEALGYRAVVADSVSESVVAGNEEQSLSSTSDLEEHVKTGVTLLRTQSALSQAMRGGVVSVSYQTSTGGQRIAQDNATRNLTSTGGDAAWTVADDVNRVRNVRFSFTDVDTLGTLGLVNSPFRLNIEDSSGDTWELSVSNETVLGILDSNETAIRVERPDGTDAECVRQQAESGDPLTVDVTGGTVRDEPCHALRQLSDGTDMYLGTGLGTPREISFENSDNVEGTYSMVIDNGNPEGSNLNSGYSPDGPYFTNALYDVTLSYAYQSHAVFYDDTIRVAPGEVPP